MRINFKQPRYILPLILLPFLCLFFFVFHGNAQKKEPQKQKAAINSDVGNVSAHIKKSSLADKLDAFRNTYKESEGLTAVTPIATEQTAANRLSAGYNERQKAQLDSIDRAMKSRFASPDGVLNPKPGGSTLEDRQVTAALNALASRRASPKQATVAAAGNREKDPMTTFRQQMQYMDSLQKANDPALKAEREKAMAKANALAADPAPLEVRKAPAGAGEFNTIKLQSHSQLITAIIDEDITAYVGSRVRLRLLEDIWAGQHLIPQGSLLYGLVSGFTQQRISLTITSVLAAGQILPVKLSAYDQDGLAGLFVPSSAFRDFSKDVSGNTLQGVDITSNSAGTQLLMSSAGKIFQSASSAIANAIRRNKAKIKYGTQVFLIDPQSLQNH